MARDLIKTWYLKAAIIEKESTIKAAMLIFEGPKYLLPLMHGILFNFNTYFFTVPGKLLQRDFFEDSKITSSFVKQL